MEKEHHIPPGLRVYAIGDIHGYLDPLKRLHEEISMDLIRNPPEKVHIVYIGDYVDRGPDTPAVIDYLIERKARGDGIRKTFLEGNHERGLLSFVEGLDTIHAGTYLPWGGRETLACYGVNLEGEVVLPGEVERAQEALRKKIPQHHLDFLNDLSLSVQEGDYFFAHAGVDPRVPFEQQRAEDLRYIREPFLSWKGALEKRVVHGHTICKAPEVLHHRVNVDTGLYAGGKLTAGVFEGRSVRFLQVGM